MSEANREGRRRLAIVLCCAGGLTCAGAMALVLILYGTPYESYWWAVMAAILAASCVLPRLLVPMVEWVVEGYRHGNES